MSHLLVVDINTGQVVVLSEEDEILVRVMVDLGIIAITKAQVGLSVLGILPLCIGDHIGAENRRVTFGANLDIGRSSLPDGRVTGLGEDVEICEDGAFRLRLTGIAPHTGLCTGCERTRNSSSISQTFKCWPIPNDGTRDKGDICSR